LPPGFSVHIAYSENLKGQIQPSSIYVYCIDAIFFMVIWPSGFTSFQFESYIGYFGLSPKCKEILWILELQRFHQILDHPPLIHRENSQNALFAKVGAIYSWMHFGIKL
jgi:hypothetical protein